MRKSEGTFEPSGGLRLFERSWLPDGEPKCAIVIVHGYAEHSGRYDYAGGWLAERGYAVHALDLRGHGRSEGERVFVRSFNEYLDDVDAFIARVRERHGGATPWLLGHSMGGSIVALSAVTRRPDVRGLLLSGAGLKATSHTPWIVTRIILLLGRFAPRLRLRKLAAADVSRDPEVVALYDSDPLNFRGKMPAGLVASMIRAGRVMEQRMDTVDGPLLIMHGTEDALTNPEGSRELYRRAASTDKTLKLYEGLFHEILNEPEKDQVLADIAGWLDARTDTSSSSESSAAG
jgi:alpha-beta hydrolase superfamily lysophospholipase